MAKIDELLQEMKKTGTSNLHLLAGFPPIHRLKGQMIRASRPAFTHEELTEMFYEILSQEQQQQLEKNRELDFAYEIPEMARFRCSLFFQHRGMGGVFRLIPLRIPSSEELRLPEVMSKIAAYRKGTILVTGPSGSGKSTTLAVLVDLINKSREAHILTIESPIEFVHRNAKSLITQREVGTHAHGFADALRAAMREDPDVILISELSDPEVISPALTCASLGILVIGCLHSNNAVKAIEHVSEVFPLNEQNQIRTMLGDSLRAVIAQQLVDTKDGKSRCPAVEILLEAPTLGNLVREGKTGQIPPIIQTGAGEGMQSMDTALKKLIDEDLITPESAAEKALDKNSFLSMIKESEFETPELS